MAACLSCSAELLTSYKFCPRCGQSQKSNDGAGTSKLTPTPTTKRSSNKTLGYKQFKELKGEKRATYFRREKKNRNAECLDEKVTVNVGFMKYDGVDMKGQRGKSLPLTITKSSDRKELMDAAFGKLKAHNMAEIKSIGDYELLYSDATVVEKLRESDEPFVLHKYKKEYGKPYSRITFYLSLKTDLINYKLTALKKAIYSSPSCESQGESDSEGSQSKKLKTEPKRRKPSMVKTQKPVIQVVDSSPVSTSSNTELEQTEPKQTEQIETDAAIALALQMENVDNTYAALFTVDDQLEELSTNEETCSDDAVEMSSTSGKDDAQTPTIEAVVTELAQQVDFSNITKFNVVRTHLFDSAKRALNRKKFDPGHKVSVKFMDDVGSSEGAVDLGGPKREFFTLLLHSLLYESPLFFGHENSRYISLNQKSFEEEEYRLAGMLIALSLVHGGPVPHCLSNLLFQALVGGVQGVKPRVADMENIHDATKDVILSLNDVTPENVNTFIDSNERLSTVVDLAGAWKPVKTSEDKLSITNSLIKWFLVSRSQCAILQFQKGLEILGVLDKMRQFPGVFRQLMCYSPNRLTVECFEAKLSYDRSEMGSNSFQVENAVLGFWGDFLVDASEGECQLELKDVLMFISGCLEFPPLGLEIIVKFLHGERGCKFPKANTCACELSLPIQHTTYASFKDDMTFAILNSKVFGQT